MDPGAPSDVELLDMAREVLSVCSTSSLKDIIEDLTMTGSSEMTINRIFDGQFLQPLQVQRLTSASMASTSPTRGNGNGALHQLSSEDENSDNDEFLRFMAGASSHSKDNNGGARNQQRPPPSPPAIRTKSFPGTDIRPVQDNLSSTTVKSEPASSRSNHPLRDVSPPVMIKSEASSSRNKQLPRDVSPPVVIKSKASSSRNKQPQRDTSPPIFKKEPSLSVSTLPKQDELPANIKSKPTSRHAQRKERSASPPDTELFPDGNDDIWEDHGYYGDDYEDNNWNDQDDWARKKSHGPSFQNEKETSRSKGTADIEDVVIDLALTTEQKQQKVDRKFLPMSAWNNADFPHWDSVLITVRANSDAPPAVMLTSPRSMHRTRIISPDARHATTTYANNHYDDNDVSDGNTSEDAISASCKPRRLFSSGISSPPAAVSSTTSKTRTHSLRNGFLSSDDDMLSASHKESIESIQDLDRNDDPIMSAERQKWNHLLDTSLSPPLAATTLDDTDDSDLERLMDDMASRSRSGASKSRSTRRKSPVSKGKKRALVPAFHESNLDIDYDLDLNLSVDEWGKGHLQDNGVVSLEEQIIKRAQQRKKKVKSLAQQEDDGDLMSLEEEIVRKARRKRTKASNATTRDGNNDDEDGEADSNSVEGPSAAERRKAEKEAEKLAREAEREALKQAKEAEKLAKKAAREQEMERKRALKLTEKAAKEQERQEEVKAAREVRLANRLTNKTESAKEMIVCIEESLYWSKFGETLRFYLEAIDCQICEMPATTRPGGSSRNITAGGGMGDRGSWTNDALPVKNVAFWRRAVRQRYDDDQEMFVPLAQEEIELEAFSLVYMTATDLASKMQNGQFRDYLALVKRDMRLRKNREQQQQQQRQLEGLRPKESSGQRQRVIFLLSGLESYFLGLKKITKKRFEQAYRAGLDGGAGQQSSARGVVEEPAPIDQEMIEKELLWLQVEQDCLIMQANNDDESAQIAVSLTEQIGLRPYKATRRLGLNVSVEGIKSGQDSKDTWIKSLGEIHMVTQIHARSIAEEYPTLRSLYEGYRACSGVYQAQLLLEDIPVIGRRSTVGRALSRRIYDIFMSEDPEKPVVM
ncbi:hypothetical protein BGZ98_001840 [Dissophora globulifera]|nr:hypothetical protein BGZ98_001840 [Dissophora globulifera]